MCGARTYAMMENGRCDRQRSPGHDPWQSGLNALVGESCRGVGADAVLARQCLGLRDKGNAADERDCQQRREGQTRPWKVGRPIDGDAAFLTFRSLSRNGRPDSEEPSSYSGFGNRERHGGDLNAQQL